MAKTTHIHIRVTEEVKQMAERQAESEGRSLANYIAWLIVEREKGD